MLSARILRAHRICKIAHFALQFGRFYFPKSAILQTNFAHFARKRFNISVSFRDNQQTKNE